MKLPLSVNHYHLEDADGKCVAASFWAGRQISDFDDDETNLCDIARAVNNHAALVEALEELVAWMPDPELDKDDIQREIVLKAKAALAAAKGEA